ncbi:hypothetical protein M422DRAFT_78174, partial [Sphaerobolus stellatus SS14]
YLHHLLWPCFDDLVWVVSMQVVPNYMACVNFLERSSPSGHEKALISFWKWFKT